MDEILTCSICDVDRENFRRLSKHIRDAHSINSETYWNLNNARPMCVCGKPTTFQNLSLGYKATCSHKCAATNHRREMRESPEKFDSFRKKVSENMTVEWAERKVDGRAEIIFGRASASNRKEIAKLSVAERCKKYTHNPGGHPESLKRFYRDISDEDFQAIRRKALNTMASQTSEVRLAALQVKVDKWVANGGHDALNKFFGIQNG